jgi:hypothetical protein
VCGQQTCRTGDFSRTSQHTAVMLCCAVLQYRPGTCRSSHAVVSTLLKNKIFKAVATTAPLLQQDSGLYRGTTGQCSAALTTNKLPGRPHITPDTAGRR